MITRDFNSIIATVVENENVASRVDFTLNISANLYDMSSDDIASEYEREDSVRVPSGFVIEPTADAPVNCDYILTVDDDVEYSDALGDGRCSAYQFVDCSYDEDTHECRIYKYHRDTQHIDDEEYFIWVSRFEFMGDVYDKWRKIDTGGYESYVLTQPIVDVLSDTAITNSNYRKGVLSNYVAFRVLRSSEIGRYEYGDSGTDWVDVTCGESTIGFSGKMNDVIVHNLPVYDGATETSPRYDLLFTKYEDSYFGYYDYWNASSNDGGDDVPEELEDFDYAVNFGRFFDSEVYNEQGFGGNSYEWFDNANGERDEHMNYYAVIDGNGVEINYHSDNNRYTYYIEFRYPMLLMGESNNSSSVGWVCDSYYVYPFYDGATYYSEYVDYTCVVPTASLAEIMSVGCSTLSLNEYGISLSDHSDRYFASQIMDITFDLRKKNNIRKVQIASVGGAVGRVTVGNDEVQLPYTGYFVIGDTVDINFYAHPHGDIMGITDNDESITPSDDFYEIVYSPIDIDHIIYVEYSEIHYDVTTSSNSYGTLSGGGSHQIGTDVRIGVHPNLPSHTYVYLLSQLLDNGSDVTNSVVNKIYTIGNIMEDHNVSAIFSRNTVHMVTLSCGDGGTSNPVSGSYAIIDDSLFMVDITPNIGYIIASVYDNDILVTDQLVPHGRDTKRYSTTVNEPHEIDIRFRKLILL